MSTIDEETLKAFLADHGEWSKEGDKIARDFKAASDKDAVKAIDRIAAKAIDAGHHPELKWVYDSLHIELTTHDAGGLTTKDTDLAAAIDEVLADTPSG